MNRTNGWLLLCSTMVFLGLVTIAVMVMIKKPDDEMNIPISEIVKDIHRIDDETSSRTYLYNRLFSNNSIEWLGCENHDCHYNITTEDGYAYLPYYNYTTTSSRHTFVWVGGHETCGNPGYHDSNIRRLRNFGNILFFPTPRCTFGPEEWINFNNITLRTWKTSERDHHINGGHAKIGSISTKLQSMASLFYLPALKVAEKLGNKAILMGMSGGGEAVHYISAFVPHIRATLMMLADVTRDDYSPPRKYYFNTEPWSVRQLSGISHPEDYVWMATQHGQKVVHYQHLNDKHSSTRDPPVRVYLRYYPALQVAMNGRNFSYSIHSDNTHELTENSFRILIDLMR